jgi:crotonobetainyl-CoA:carnitine CoA-transferase CaiB-like acyl-CoA transferase
LGFPPHLREGAVSYRLPPPTLGQHSEQVLAELGYDACEVVRLRELKVI